MFFILEIISMKFENFFNSKLIISLIVFSYNVSAYSAGLAYLCSGKYTITINNQTKVEEKNDKRIIFKDNRLFVPGMMLLCQENNKIFECQNKRLDSIWQAEFDASSNVLKYYSYNVTENKTQNFDSKCIKQFKNARD